MSGGCELDRIRGAIAVAAGYVLEDANSAELWRAVGTATGDRALSPRVAATALEVGRHHRELDELTRREREVLALLAQGLSNRAIGCRLGIAEKTVKRRLTAIFHRIGVTGRVQAGLWAHARRAWLEASLPP
jgi:two-component system response regulator DevR